MIGSRIYDLTHAIMNCVVVIQTYDNYKYGCFLKWSDEGIYDWYVMKCKNFENE